MSYLWRPTVPWGLSLRFIVSGHSLTTKSRSPISHKIPLEVTCTIQTKLTQCMGTSNLQLVCSFVRVGHCQHNSGCCIPASFIGLPRLNPLSLICDVQVQQGMLYNIWARKGSWRKGGLYLPLSLAIIHCAQVGGVSNATNNKIVCQWPTHPMGGVIRGQALAAATDYYITRQWQAFQESTSSTTLAPSTVLRKEPLLSPMSNLV